MLMVESKILLCPPHPSRRLFPIGKRLCTLLSVVLENLKDRMPSKRTWTSLRSGPLGNPMRFHKMKCKELHLGRSIHAGDDQKKNSRAEKDLGVLVGEEDEHDPEMCTHSPDRQRCPGLHQDLWATG